METKEFKAESKRLLDMMINSIYTHKEIFLRELISNASDAIDKLYFKSLTDDKVGLNKSDFEISVAIDKDARTITVTDNGIGMTKDELENNLGTIAKSGSLDFKSENDTKEKVDIIGQFGVGFYSAFMVAKTVTVRSKAYGSDEAYEWQSEGVDGYTIDKCDKQSVGTEIILVVKDNTEDENYDEFLEQYRIQGIIRKYSDYISTPITMNVEKSRKKDDSDEYEKFIEKETINSMVPIWKKNKSEITDEEYNKFYTEKFFDYNGEPLAHMHVKTEGTATYNALLYIPSKAPHDFYTREYEKGLKLYANGVLIMDKCADLIPDHFSFVKGLVDSEDLSLNISREMLQQDRQLKIIAKSLERTIKNELTKMLKNDREKYEKFFKEFGLQLKAGIQNDMFGMNNAKDTLKDLIMFYSSSEKKMVTLEEYVDRMKEDQKYIYYVTGESIARIESLPQTELVKDKGFEILYCTENIDEFTIKALVNYKEKEFKSVSSGDLDIESDDQKEEIKAKNDENKDMFKTMVDALGGKVKDVRISSRLKTHPVCITSEGEISLEMEKILNSMPGDNKVKAERILEINPDHAIFSTLKNLEATDKEKLGKYAQLLYSQALMIEGIPVENPVEFSNLICELMV
ncbi:MAG: molecular chaperone HtpG [Oscillospiraceae bacterium]